jgi:hypothetical protein
MEKWKSQSHIGKQVAAAVVCIVFGIALAIGFHNFTGPGMTNSKAGFLLGVLLLVIGVAGFLMQARQTVIVDPAGRRITIEDETRFGTKRRSIGFQEIVEVRVGYLGKRSNLVTNYYLVLKLRSGEEYPLFAPGRFYAGASERATVEGWRVRLEEYIRS